MNANEVQLATAEDSGVGSNGEESRNERPGIDLHVTKAAAHEAARAALLARHDANRKTASAISAASAHVDELLRAVGLDGTRSASALQCWQKSKPTCKRCATCWNTTGKIFAPTKTS